ncbi:DegT/DnrJ/EryC1/StrS family aminotransferase [Bradyrhizobium japonicum]|uniref:DegT/DnrJ/EryC1/StrS family aminotransferase n=1 Tax=Bradyrhizobium japonicum TaxID=375 RepID=UPI001BA946F1|nr:DegT/DnrJ/EryC1/StrS family aminotransferase [Bradyrhizobium japonicum]MBR0994707.1 DegT/DnrJ/EryC1/StrS family aminotransferase [Bradyrhizobium japonicum]
MIKFLDLQAQYLSIKGELDAAVADVIQNAAFVGGPYVRAFEQDFAKWTKAPYCIGVGNGTDALEIAIEALGLPAGSEIIVPGNSFIATSEAVSRCGHRVIFADVDPDCYTLDAESVLAKLTARTAAIIPVHLYGHPCDMASLKQIALERGLRIVEDCAQAHGAEFDGRRVGTIGDVGTFSFYPGKNLGAYGDAGAIVTNDEVLARKMRMIANHGRIAKYDHQFEGRSSRLDGLQAAILNVKLRHLNRWTEHRIAIADRYLDRLRDISGLTLPVRKIWARQVYHLFVVRTEQRDGLAAHLQAMGVQTGIHYPIALPKLQAYATSGQADEDMFVNRSDAQLLSLPIGEHMTMDDVDIVVAAVRNFFK